MLKWVGLGLLALLLALQFRLWVGEGSIAQVAQLKRQIAEQKASNEKLRERNERLDAEVRDLKEGLDGIEERARGELGMVKPGEQFILLIEKPQASPKPHER